MPDKTVTFTLKNSDYDSVKKLYTNLSLPDIAFKGENGKIKLVALDKKNSNSNAKIAHFINKKVPVQYWIALEADSTF
jgi:hypothetical protein